MYDVAGVAMATVTSIGVPTIVAANPALGVIVYLVIIESDFGATHVIVAVLSPATAVGAAMVSGTFATGADAVPFFTFTQSI